MFDGEKANWMFDNIWNGVRKTAVGQLLHI